jgi:hypothetical protein
MRNEYFLEYTLWGSDKWEAQQSFPTEEAANKALIIAKRAMGLNDPIVELWSGVRIARYFNYFTREI